MTRNFKILVLTLLIVVLLQILPKNNAEEFTPPTTRKSIKLTERIVGGNIANSFEFVKYLASLRKKEKIFWGSEHLCGGSILSLRIIITAAHCLKGPVYRKHVVIGTLNRLKKNEYTQEIYAKSSKVHEGYVHGEYFNDIGLVYLAYDMREDFITVQRISLPDEMPKIGTKCICAGWGSLYENGPMSSDVLMVELEILPLEYCAPYESRFGKGMICAADPTDQGKDSCKSDSGGPLICNQKLAGIVSYGHKCASELPGVYTDVWFFRDWIAENGAFKLNVKIKNFLILIALVLWEQI